MTEIEWQAPPPARPRRADLVAAELRAKPGEWALIARHQPAFLLLPWWGPICNSPGYETRLVPADPTWPPLGPKDVYARYTGGQPRG